MATAKISKPAMKMPTRATKPAKTKVKTPQRDGLKKHAMEITKRFR